jgi:ubiquinone/menaquinone biosynthesis C-methylase UbiE
VKDIIEHYEHRYREEHRLHTDLGPLEFARTQELILQHLPAAPARVLDIGGGPGAYTFWLHSLGYEVHLLDLVLRHARHAHDTVGVPSATVGDACQLPFGSESADAVLLLGPLYHLTDRRDRLRALSESRRVLRNGGVLFAAAISRFASLLDGLFTGAIDDTQFQRIVERDLQEGQHRNDSGPAEYFTTAYFHHPREIGEELHDSGLELTALAGIEGPVWIVRDFSERWADPSRRSVLMEMARAVEREPSIVGMSLHILAIGRRSTR